MRKNIVVVMISGVMFWSCVTLQPPPPSVYIGELPPGAVAELTLDERIRVEEAWQHLKSGNPERAERLIQSLGPGSLFYYAGLGYAYFLMKMYPSAEEYFRASLSYYPDLVLGHLGLAQVYERTGQDDLAFAEFREVLKIYPDHPWIVPRYEQLKSDRTEELLNEAKTYAAAGNLTAGKQAFLKALYYTPDSLEAHLSLGRIFKDEEDYRTAIIHLKAAQLKSPDDPEILRIYADTLFLAEDFKSSLEVYQKLQRNFPDDTDIRDRLEILKNRLGIFELPSQYGAIASSETITKEEIAAVIAVKLKDIIDAETQKPPIIIDIATSWASRYILQTTSLGILDVYPNHTFQPKKVVTRAEMAEILVRVIDTLRLKGYELIQQIPPGRIQVTDVSLDNYYHQPIIRIVSYGIMNLTGDRTFQPDRPVKGSEAIRFLDHIRALIQ